jgi:hypothetical protein
MNNNLTELRGKVLTFLKAQPGFDSYKNEELKSVYENPQCLAVIFGDNLQEGIAGFGEDVDKAYQDFLQNWEKYGGLEWLKQYK